MTIVQKSLPMPARTIILACMWEWRITEYEGGRQLLDVLALRIPAAPRGYLHQLVRKGRVCADGAPLDEKTVVASGTLLTLPDSSRLAELAAACGIPPCALLHEDQSALVVDKPAGLAVHPAVGHSDDLTSRVARFVALRHAPYRVAPVHRLDVGTSGPVLFGKGRQATGRYGQLLMDGRLRKYYLALVAGPMPAAGELTTPVPDGGVPKPALTRYRRLAAAEHVTLLNLELLTGRPHQIRRQLADAGRPIIGDRRYGGPLYAGLGHPFLHCHRLCFPLLDSGDSRCVDSPLPAALQAILRAEGIDMPADRPVAAENPAALTRSGYNDGDIS